MPHINNGRGTFVLDVVVPGDVGRIKRASGTTDRATFKRLRGMIEVLRAKGRLDLLRGLRDHTFTPLQLWDAYRRDDLDALPSAETLAPLWTLDGAGAVDRWLAAWKQSADHLRATASTFAQLRKLAPEGAAVGTLPALLARYRAQCEAQGYATSFNNARSHVQSFLREHVGPSHRLYTEVRRLKRLPKGEREARGGLTVAAFDALVVKLAAVSPAHAEIAAGMALTGMGPKEYWGRWEVEGDRVRIFGTKREGRRRVVPLLAPLTPPARHPRTFADRLAQVSGGTVEPYDLRRTFAHWLEEAGIPRTRRRLYRGHQAGDVGDLYEAHEVTAYLAADAARLRAYLASRRQEATGSPTTDTTTPAGEGGRGEGETP